MVKLIPTYVSGNDANTIFLCHCDGVNAGTSFTDSSAVARAVTATGAANTNNTQVKFGTSACQITTSGALTIPSAADLNFGTGDFTVEMWLYPTSATVGLCVGKRASSATTSGIIILENTTQYTFLASIGSSFVINTNFGTLTTNTWAHLAVERFGTQFNAYYNGTRTNCGTNAGSIDTNASVMSFGRDLDPTNAVIGYLDEIRVSKVARYQSTSFTPPVTPYG